MLHQFDVYRVAKAFHWACIELRMHKIHREQIFRASSSMVLNIAEGSGKRTNEDRRRYYSSAFGSLRECQSILELERIENREIKNLLDRLGAMLFKLSRPYQPATNPDTDTNRRLTATETPDGDAEDERPPK